VSRVGGIVSTLNLIKIKELPQTADKNKSAR